VALFAHACVEGGDNPSHKASNEKWDAVWQQEELGMLDAVNFYRAEGAICGDQERAPVPPLELDTVIQIASRLHSLDMATQDYFDHEGLDGRDPFMRMEDVGFSGAYPWGENIEAGSQKAAEAVAHLMTSPPHCENMMSPDYKVAGFGYAAESESEYKHYWTQNFAASH
jgi:uncharacterized protein YkwD